MLPVVYSKRLTKRQQTLYRPTQTDSLECGTGLGAEFDVYHCRMVGFINFMTDRLFYQGVGLYVHMQSGTEVQLLATYC